MEQKEILKKLQSLVQLDIDAMRAYEQALKSIDVREVHDRIHDFYLDHERHVRTLSAVIVSYGEKAPEWKSDVKGFFISSFTAIRSSTGTEGALKAMRSNEKLTNSTYEAAEEWDMPENLMTIIREHLTDERRHLSYIESALAAKMWELETAE
jgi:rubrerythrin